MLAFPPDQLLAVRRDHIGSQALLILRIVPILRHLWVHRGKTEVLKSAVTAVRTAYFSR